MDEAITCACGSQSWVIGTAGTRCLRCHRELTPGLVIAKVREANMKIERDWEKGFPVKGDE